MLKSLFFGQFFVFFRRFRLDKLVKKPFFRSIFGSFIASFIAYFTFLYRLYISNNTLLMIYLASIKSFLVLF